MHALHDYVAKQLAEKVKSRRIVVWYDDRREFVPFVNELRGGPRASSEPVSVSLGGAATWLLEYDGLMFELRSKAEPHVSKDDPDPVVVYVPGRTHDSSASVLMELETAGMTWQPQLKQLARLVLLQRYTQGVVDELLPAGRNVSYEDLARVASSESGSEPPSILKSIFSGQTGPDAILAAWLVSAAQDAEIGAKDATRELTKLVSSRLGLTLDAEAPLPKLRAVTLRYVLGGEFRLDLGCEAPAALAGIPTPPSKAAESALRTVARLLRSDHSNEYAALADGVEAELSLDRATLPAEKLGSIDTFRFEERSIIRHGGNLVSDGKFVEALALVTAREHSFWLDRDVSRRAQWEALRRMAELGRVSVEVRAAVAEAKGDAAAWLAAYVTELGWFRVDQAQRRLEAWITNLDEPTEERPLAVVRRAYEEACYAMAAGFTKALAKGGWTVSGALHQTRIFSEIVAARPKPVAYFLVDAMRFEMGAELAERLPRSSEVTLRAAVAALPSITPIGMAALMPGAATSFSVVERGGKLGARIDDSFLPDLPHRKKLAAARVPNLVDLDLDELLSAQPSRLSKKVDGAQVVIVRSQEIDHAGEGRFPYQARQVMDTVIDNLARAIRKLSNAGIEHAVITADHGHLFFADDRDESMRTDAPGGAKVELHRRCWIGRGGSNPTGCVRVPASALGYDSDLEFVFPSASGVFRAGGDLAFHHGGTSLQEMVIPVIGVRTPRSGLRASVPPSALSVVDVERVTNRIFTIRLRSLFSLRVRVTLLAKGREVGQAGMAVDAELEPGTSILTTTSGREAVVAMRLTDDAVEAVRVIVLDATTDAELYRSARDIPVEIMR